MVSNDIWTARRDGWINIRSAVTGRIMNRVVTDDAMIMCLEHVSDPANNASAVWAGSDDGSIQVYNSRKATRTKTLRHHTGSRLHQDVDSLSQLVIQVQCVAL